MNRRDLLKFLTLGGVLSTWAPARAQEFPQEFQIYGLLAPPIQRMWCDRNGNMFNVAWSGNTDGANTALYMPLTIDSPFVFDRFWNITTSANGNLDIGLYLPTYAKIVSTGSTAQAGSSELQLISAGATYRLERGTYWLGISANNSSTTSMSGVNGGGGGANYLWAGLAVQTSAFPLPDPMVPARPTAAKNYILPVCGLVGVGW